MVSKSVILTFNSEKTYHSFRIKLNKSIAVRADVKILQVTGKAKKQRNGKIYWGGYSSEGGIGSFFYSLKPKSFKKGTTLHSEDGVWKNSGVTFNLPNGIKKLKVEITIKTEDSSSSLIKVKETKVKDYYVVGF